MKLRILASAKRDLEEGQRFYEAQDTGLGGYFLASVTADIERLRISAGVHAVVHRDYHPGALPSVPVCHLLHEGRRCRDDLRRGGLPARSRLDSSALGEEQRTIRST